ncbi:MAG TPA: PASTA domain-containing protein [Gaiellaceae bacterium]|nr:PASTA domain-containing protein [Gaiellaceae bacterium]
MTNLLRPGNRRMSFAIFAVVGLALLLGFPSAALAAAPQAITNEVDPTGATTATVDGLVNPGGESTTYSVQWDVNSSAWCQSLGQSGSPANTTSATPFPDTGNAFEDVTVDLTDLTGGTDYCAQLIANNGSGESDGGTEEWTQGLPVAITIGETPTGATTSTIQGQVDPVGQSTTYKVQWDLNSSIWCQNFGTSGSPAHTTAGTVLSFSDNTFHDVSVGITGLVSGTDFCAQLIATNASGESDGGTVEWTQVTPPNTLTVSRAGTGSGTVTSSPAGIDCGATCSAMFDTGSQVTLTAAAAAGSTFAGWSGGGCSGTSTCKVTLSADTGVTATFNTTPPVMHTLTISPAGSGSGSVTSSPAGIDCGATCSHAFNAGTQVTLTAAADSGSTFTGWSGGGCSGTSNCVVTLNSDTGVTATFTTTPPPPPKPCVVPNVKGKKLAAAKASIRSHHCSVGKITRVKSSSRNRGKVVSQSPKPGKQLAHGAKVALKVGK